MKKVSPEALKLSQQYHPTSVKFKDKELLARLAEISKKTDYSQRQIIEYAVSRILDVYDRVGPSALASHMPLTIEPEKIITTRGK
jgi:hypothetical protein